MLDQEQDQDQAEPERSGGGGVCDTCGNAYDKPFTVTWGGETRTFDSFECAAHAMAPICVNCGCRILGHGVENLQRLYCCAHCVRAEGEHALVDRA